MAYKTLFSALSDPDLMPSLIDQSAALARKYDAHFDALCLGVDRTQAGYYYGGGNAMVIQQSLERAHDEVKALTEEAERRLHTQDILWGLDNGVTQLADMGRHIGNRARFSDLGIAARPYGEGMGIELEGIVEAMLFDGGIPVMVIPTEAKPIVTPKVITLAWNESPEALAATRAALPILQEADRVRVAVIDPPQHGPERSDPGGRLSQFLARHGVRAEIDVLSKTMPRVADVILRHVADGASDLVVMGAYGHSRFREAILGGATRDMLELSPVPVFMAH
ncbi:universal stress protein [Thalassovita mediterranea]|jgi:nucleotide-binding universal stress UspA family protein|uniref:Universal stress protein family protein n=1 Tax=Thalassovita mediterranea TaxID=340021 RepID=A0A0P1H126_9RHOB|nr:universal stress protein [Thalassovita mediterranea]MCG7574988.1 universal stress protein [Phaeobacter sp. CNT1-3]CUH83548.1 Universal stress protein family protein [Thalassovita mediterranea]SIS34447.1 Nucleotide-binding universal stress protein, UspA family [Thalassovita mediterranea]